MCSLVALDILVLVHEGDIFCVCVCLCGFSVSDPDKRLQALWVTCDGLPKSHKANLR